MNQETRDKYGVKFAKMTPEQKTALAETLGVTEDELTADFAASTEAPPAATASVAPDPKIQAQLDKLTADLEARNTRTLDERAAQFADKTIYKDKKAFPAERDDLIAVFKMAANADGEANTATFTSAGDIVEGANLKTVYGSIEKRPTIAHFESVIPDAAPGDTAQFAASDEVKNKVMGATAIGQKALELKKESK